jgi:hypothetical protein
MPGDSEEVLTPDDLARAAAAPAGGSGDDSEPSPSGDDSHSSGQPSGLVEAARGDSGGEAE